MDEKHSNIILPGSRRKPYCYAGVKVNPAGWSWPVHSHEEWQFFLVLEGEVFLAYGGETKHLARGMVSIIPPGVPHRIWAETRYIQFGADLFNMPEYEIVALMTENIHAPIEIEFHEGLSACEGMDALASLNDRISFSLLFTRTDEILLRILQRITGSWENSFQRELEQYLSKHLDGTASLKTVASHMNLSASQCERMCRRYYGCGVMALARQMRTRRACDLLNRSSLSIKEVSALCGFLDAAHFTRFFKDTVGRTPSAYRGGGGL